MATLEYDTVAAVARLANVPRTTLQDAVSRGEITEHHLAGGAVVVSVLDVHAWQAETRKRGRKPKQPRLTRAPDGSLHLSEAPGRPVTADTGNRATDSPDGVFGSPARQDTA